MKKLLLFALIITSGVIASLTDLSFAQVQCDQTFTGSMRYWKGYIFNDTFNNPGPGSYYLRNYKIEYTEQYDYNNSADFPLFGRTDTLKLQDYEVKGGESIKILEAQSPYYIYSVPASRARNNFFMKYTLTYSPDIAGNTKYNHTECKYYEITRCGDGIKDSTYGEECDGNDGTPTGYQCIDCKLVIIPAPTCTLSLDKTNIVSGENVTLSWNIIGTADFPTSIIANPVLPSFPHSVSTNVGSKTFPVNKVGTYDFSMTVKNINGQYTCNTAIDLTVTPEAPTCTLSLDKTNIVSGENVTLSWNIIGTADFPTSIIANPVLPSFPHSVSTNVGSKTFPVNKVGTYDFSMTVKNINGQYTCNTDIDLIVTPEEIPPTPRPTDPDPK